MKHTIKKAFTLFLSFAMVLSLISGIVPMIIPEAQAAETPDLKVGVISDVHLGYAWDPDLQTPRFYKALKTYKEMGVDAIIIAGDLNDQGISSLTLEGQKAYMEEFADVWFAVFPEKKGEEGYVEPVLIYGNHDVDLIAAGYWPERFGTYSDVQTWEVNGYQFVGVHNGKEDKVTTEVADAVAATPDKPVFYIQHCPIAYTVGRSMGGYGSSYSLAGRNNISAYSNIVSFAGHNHMPLTDERSIWQGESWNDGQFTAINTASLNYGDADANEGGINGTSTATQHGMLMTVTGSEVTIERFSFEGLSVDLTGVTVTDNSSYGSKAQYTNVSELATKDVTGEYVQIGKTWSFDACDVTDRPYTYSARVAAAKQPVFNVGEMTLTGAEASDGTYTLTVAVPAATVADPANGVYRDIVHNYIVEACDPLTGEVEAFASEASEFHIDDDPSRLSDSYTMLITGLEPGKTYTVNAYARETFQKRSEPLTATYTAGGTLTSFRTGDINTDGVVNEDDLALLNKILAGEAAANSMVDVDGNKIVEKADATALENLLAGKTMVTDEGDLMSGATTPAWSSTTAFTQMQTAVTLGDSNVAYNSYAIEVSSWPDAHIYFEEPQDWSNKNVINFNILFENEYKVGDYTSPTRQVRFYVISGANKERSTGYLSRESFDTDEAGWCQYSLYLNTLGNVDWSNVYGLLLDINYDGATNRFDGVTPHGFYLDNVTTSLSSGKTDDDILGQVTTVTGGKIVYNTGDTRDSYQAIKSTSTEMVVTLPEAYKLGKFKSMIYTHRLTGSTTYTVQAVAEDGTLLGTAATVNACDTWVKGEIDLAGLGLDGTETVTGLKFTIASGTLNLDSMSLTAKPDQNDLLANATVTGGAVITSAWYYPTPVQTAMITNPDTVYSTASWEWDSPNGATPNSIWTFAETIDLTGMELKFDVKFANGTESTWKGANFKLYDESDNVLVEKNGARWASPRDDSALLFTAANEDGWYTATLNLSDVEFDRTAVRKISLAWCFDGGIGPVYIDNMRLEKIVVPDTDLIAQSSSLSTSGSTQISIAETITNGSSYALLFDNTNGSGNWTYADLKFDTPVDLSAAEVLKMDVKRTNVYPSGGSERQFRVYLYDADGNVVYTRVPTVVDCDWSTLLFDLRYTYASSAYSAVNAADLADIAKIRIQFYCNANEVTVVDNMTYGAHLDDDLISAATAWNIDYTVINFVTDNTNNSSEAVEMPYVSNEWPKFELLYSQVLDLSDTPVVTVDVKRTTTSGDVKLAFYNSAGTEVCTQSYVSVGTDWKTLTYDLSELGADVLQDIAKIRVYAAMTEGDSLIIDNLYAYPPELDPDTDMLAQATITYDNSTTCTVSTVTSQTNNSNFALQFEGNVGATSWPKITLTFDEPLDLSETPVLRLDVWKQNMSGNFNFTVYNASGAVFNLYQYNIASSDGWGTYDIDMSVYRVKASTDTSTATPIYSDSWANYYKTDLTQLENVTKIVIQVSAEGTDNTVAAKMLLDNMYAVASPTEGNLFTNATVTAPSYFGTDFEPLFTTVDNRNDVLYLHSDPTDNTACTHSNGWAGYFKIKLNGSVVDGHLDGGYAAFGKKVLRFDIKYAGLGDTYVGVKFFDVNGADLGSAKAIRPAASDEWTTCHINLSDMSITEAELARIAYIGFEFNWQDQIAGATNAAVADVYISNVKLYDASVMEIPDDVLAEASITMPSAWSGVNFSAEVKDVNGLTNVAYIYNDPTTNDSYATDSWKWMTINLGGKYVGYDTGYDLTDYDYVEFYVDFGCVLNGSDTYLTSALYDVNGNQIGSTFANSTTTLSGFHYYRIPLSAFGLTSSQLQSVGKIGFRPCMGTQTASGSHAIMEFMIDDIRFGKADSEDLMENVYVMKDLANRSVYYQQDTANGRTDIFSVVTKVGSTTSGWVQNEQYKFGTAMTVESDWTISYDALLQNYYKYIVVQIVGSDGNRYTMCTSDGTKFTSTPLAENSWYTRETGAISQFTTTVSDETVYFDASTVKVVGFSLTYYLNSSLATEDAPSYLALDNVHFVDPSAE